MKRLFALIVSAAVPFICQAANWVQIGHSENMTLLVDAESIGKADNYVKAWFIYDYKSMQALGNGKKYQSTLLMNYFSCKDKTMMTKQVVYYTGPAKSGDIAFSNSYPFLSSSMDDIVPDSVAEAGFEVVCKK